MFIPIARRMVNANFHSTRGNQFNPVPERTSTDLPTHSPVNLDYVLDYETSGHSDEPYVGQGGCVTEDGVAIVFRVYNDSTDDTFREAKAIGFDLATYTKLWECTVNTAHCNDACYVDGYVYIPTQEYIVRYKYNRAAGLSDGHTIPIDRFTRGISYDRYTGTWYGAEQNEIFTIDLDTGTTTVVATLKIPRMTYSGLLSQGIEVVNGYAYLVYSFPNTIFMVDLTTGETIRTYSVPQNYLGHIVGELEALSFDYENNYFVLFSYGRGFDLPTYDDGNLGINHIWYWGSNVIANPVMTYKGANGESDGHTQGTERYIYVNDNPCHRHTGDAKYPFTRLPDALYFLATAPAMSGRPWYHVKVYNDQSRFSVNLHIVQNTKMFLYTGAKINDIYVENGNNFEIRVEDSSTASVHSISVAGNSNLYVSMHVDELHLSRNTHAFIDRIGDCFVESKDSIIKVGVEDTDRFTIDSHGSIWFYGDGEIKFEHYTDDDMGHLTIKGLQPITLPDDFRG